VTTRRLGVDWDGLELALTWGNEEVHYYLDVTTGETVSSVNPRPTRRRTAPEAAGY
jgi:hypothetical protein